MAFLYTVRGDEILVDDSDYEHLRQYSWYLTEKGYPRTMMHGKRFRMSRLIMNAEPDQTVDHINRNTLDNRRQNLRFVTLSQNQANSPRRKTNTSGYKGVSRNRNKWKACLCYNGKNHHLGSFLTDYEAAMAYDEKVYAIHGEYAFLNMPFQEIKQ